MDQQSKILQRIGELTAEMQTIAKSSADTNLYDIVCALGAYRALINLQIQKLEKLLKEKWYTKR